MAKALPNPHIPCLPPPPSRPRKRATIQQNKSRFFRLPLELRRLILREAFGGHTIHIDLGPPLVTSNLRPPRRERNSWLNYWRRLVPRLTAKPPLNERKWVLSSYYFIHDVPAQAEGRNGWDRHLSTIPGDGIDGGPCCWNGDRFPVRRLSATRRVGVMGFLLSCQWAYGETLFVLYTTNTIAIQNGYLIDGLLRQSTIPNAPQLTGQEMRLVTSLQVQSPLILWSHFLTVDTLILEHRALLAEHLELLPRAFPNLRSLTWVCSRYIYDSADFFPSRWLGAVEELLLRPLLRVSTTMPPLRKFVVPIPYQLFFTIMLLEQQRPEGRQDFLGQPLGEIQMWYPFTLSPGTLGADGGGFWLVYGDVLDRGRKYDETHFGQKLVGL